MIDRVERVRRNYDASVPLADPIPHVDPITYKDVLFCLNCRRPEVIVAVLRLPAGQTWKPWIETAHLRYLVSERELPVCDICARSSERLVSVTRQEVVRQEVVRL